MRRGPRGAPRFLLAAAMTGLAGCGGDVLERGTWRELALPPAGWRYDDVAFLDERRGWVVSNVDGEILHTADGGETWLRQAKPAERPYFRCVGFADERVGFACNLTGRERGNPLYRTSDGGASWSVVELPGVEGLCGVSIPDPQTVYLVGKYRGPAHFVASTDGGRTFRVTDLGPELGQAVDVHFFDRREGVLLGGSTAREGSRVVVWTTSDGGETWRERYRGPRDGEWGWKLSFPSRQVGYASIDTEGLRDIEQDHFLKTEDGGRTWTRRPLYAGHYRAQGIGFVTERTGWIGSFREDRPTLVTRDGGATWQEAGFGDRINRFRFTGAAGFASGHRLYKLEPAAR